MPKIAILGAHGFLGSPIADAFESAEWDVVALSRQLRENTNREEIFADIFDVESLAQALIQSKPDVVISTAWETEHGKFWTMESNVDYRDATLDFATLSFKLGVKAFIGLGTVSEYGISAGICNAETSSLVPNDIYARSKVETGLRLKGIGESFGCQTHWLRIFQAFGPHEKPGRFIPGLISTLRRGEKFSIQTPNYKLDWIHTADIASAVLYSLQNKLGHFVDIGTGIATSVEELSDLICDVLDLDSSLLDYSSQVPGHEKTIVVDPKSRLFAAGWAPLDSLESRLSSLR